MDILECLLNLICNLFTPEWITAIATAAGAGAVIWGIIVANNTLNPSLEARRGTRRAQVAEDLIITAHKIRSAINDIRRSFEGNITEEQADDEIYMYTKRYERLIGYNTLFEELREKQAYARIIIDCNEVEEAVEGLFDARDQVSFALISVLMQLRALPLKERLDFEIPQSKRVIIYDIDPNNSRINKQINDAIKTIEIKLSPIARIEENKSKRPKK